MRRTLLAGVAVALSLSVCTPAAAEAAATAPTCHSWWTYWKYELDVAVTRRLRQRREFGDARAEYHGARAQYYAVRKTAPRTLVAAIAYERLVAAREWMEIFRGMYLTAKQDVEYVVRARKEACGW